VVNTTFVVVPVTVKDFQGKLVEGLLPKDFSVFENGVKQQLRFFTSDPFALSAAVIIDLGMPDVNVQKINETYTALAGAFTPTMSCRSTRSVRGKPCFRFQHRQCTAHCETQPAQDCSRRQQWSASHKWTFGSARADGKRPSA
jgi:hypothetical protein